MFKDNVFNKLLFSAKRESRNYQNQRYDYYNQRSVLRTIKSLNDRITEVCNSEVDSLTEQSINPLGIDFGISSRELIKVYGKPRYRINGGLDKNHQILFYKLELGENTFLVQMHFYQGKMVYVKSVFDYLKSKSNTKFEVINAINAKYNIGIGDDENINKIIGDKNGNRMMIIDYGELGIQYFSGELTVYSAIKNHCHRKRSMEFQQNNNYVDLVLGYV